ncbi:MAG TPA: flavin reductase [Candidatus Merdenecus merdavium]|nr:flavin reductase [Candidatus Merdenecus merdavium]
MNSKVFRNLSYGLYVISTLDGDRPTGCIANSVMQITSSPATIALSMNHNNYTNKCIKESKKFAVSILSEASNPSLIGNFGFQSGKDVDKFKDIEVKNIDSLSVIEDTCGYITCKVIDTMETSTHTVFLADVIDGNVNNNSIAMTYAYYHNVIKGVSPKNAPTYLPPEEDTIKKQVWVCSVCGKPYEGTIPFEELPDSYTCPVCKQPKSKFVLKQL